jgi:DNA-binding MarR family transcriptional regulator
LQERTSGTDVIRRLIDAKLVRQWEDLQDKISKNLAIKDGGKELLYKVFVDMDSVSKLITGKLTIA